MHVKQQFKYPSFAIFVFYQSVDFPNSVSLFFSLQKQNFISTLRAGNSITFLCYCL